MVAEAYATLGDPQKRRAYDHNDDDFGSGGFAGGRSGAPHGRGFANDIFSQFFGGMGMDMGMGMGMGMGSRNNDSFFSDPFANDSFFSGGAVGGGGRASSGSRGPSTTICFSGSDGDSRNGEKSTNTTTSVTTDPDGTRRTKTVTITRHPDGRVERTEKDSAKDSSDTRVEPAARNIFIHEGQRAHQPTSTPTTGHQAKKQRLSSLGSRNNPINL
jgi:curved DNA-binding protein CbpA